MIIYTLKTPEGKEKIQSETIPKKNETIRLHIDQNQYSDRYIDYIVNDIIYDTYPRPLTQKPVDIRYNTTNITVIAERKNIS